MYGQTQVPSVVPVVATAGAATALPETGANATVTLAVAVLVGLVTWGVVYYYRVVRANKAA